jgi:hypothetical protein
MGALLVVFLAFVVRVAIYFDHEIARGAVEVGDVGAEAVLSAEAEAEELVASQFIPEF